VSLTQEQSDAANSAGSVAVTAGAGTGKTHMLAERYLYHLRIEGLSPLQVVAVTFTDKAAAELRARIRNRVSSQKSDFDDTVAELEAAQISTIHSLAARICRDHYQLAGLPPDFEVLDEADGLLWTSEQFEKALEEIPLDLYERVPYSTLREVLKCFLTDPVSAGRALELGTSKWDEAVVDARAAAIKRILEHPNWIDGRRVLQTYSGRAGDTMEDQRRQALDAIGYIERGAMLNESFKMLLDTNLRMGSKKNWPGGGLAEVKESLRDLRTLVKAEHELATLQLTASDSMLAGMLPVIREAFQIVKDHLTAAKRRAHVLDYNDLESNALTILQSGEAREFYRERWKAFLIDEFQDTNPIQGELITLLTEDARVTIVGDEKQSIYGFRRADVSVIRSFQKRIRAGGGEPYELSISFRTHAGLIRTMNALFKPLLKDSHQELVAHRAESPQKGPYITSFRISSGPGPGKPALERAEATNIVRRIREILDSEMLVYDRRSDSLRSVRPGDIAILSRAWAPLDVYNESLACAGIPAVHAGGGSLLNVREVKDAIAMLRFLADPYDDLALISILRGPFFSISDRDLYNLTKLKSPGMHWWQYLAGADPDNTGEVARAAEVLGFMLALGRIEPPEKLLRMADRLTGYGAVIANMPGASRRVADWHAFLELLARWERAGRSDVFTTVRHIKRIVDAEVEFPRPPLEASDAVTLTTIHGSKGLEWPVVIVPDLNRRLPNDDQAVLFDPDFGIALKMRDEDEEIENPALYKILKHKKGIEKTDELARVLYVAITRAGEAVLLTSTSGSGGLLDILAGGLEAADISTEEIPFDVDDATPQPYPAAPRLRLPETVQPNALNWGRREFPVTALSDYEQCPRRFRYRHIDGHPGIGEGPALSRRIGKLMHKALELDIETGEKLARYDELLPIADVEEALELAQRFRTDLVYKSFRERTVDREKVVRLKLGTATLNGVIDVVGDDFVLDFKSDQKIQPEHHRFQLWAYTQALGFTNGFLAYLRHGEVFEFDSTDFDSLQIEAETIIQRISTADYTASPSTSTCKACPYSRICEYYVD
jgi:ATP-dependent helicase/nuclease subunit A